MAQRMLLEHFPELEIPEGYAGFGTPNVVNKNNHLDDSDIHELKTDKELLKILKSTKCMVCMVNFPICMTSCCGKLTMCRSCFFKLEVKTKCIHCRKVEMTHTSCRDLDELNK